MCAMKLYYAPMACSLSPHIALREPGLPFDLERVDLMKGTIVSSGKELSTITPRAYVPAIVLDDGQVLTEGAVLVQWIADRRPESRLAPANGTMERVRLQEWLHYIATELHKAIGIFFNPEVSEAGKKAARAEGQAKYAHVSKQLEGKDWLMGAQYTVADGYLYWTLRGWRDFAGFDPTKDDRTLAAYSARVAARPAVNAALAAEGLS